MSDWLRNLWVLSSLACADCQCRPPPSQMSGSSPDSRPVEAVADRVRVEGAPSASAFTTPPPDTARWFAARKERAKRALDAPFQQLAKTLPGSALRPPDPRAMVWDYRLTLPFPEAWPPDERRRIVYYAYATGQSFDLSDGEYVGPVWARATFTTEATAEPEITLLDAPPGAPVVHGVHPLSREEVSVYDTEGEVLSLFFAAVHGATSPSAARQRISAYYCLLSRNSGVEPRIRALAPAFFGWLDCD